MIENYVPPDTGWGIVVGRLREPPVKSEQPEREVEPEDLEQNPEDEG